MIANAALLLTALLPQGPTEQTISRGVLESPGGDLPFLILERGRPFAIQNAGEELQLGTFRKGTGSWIFALPPYDSELEMTMLSAQGKQGELFLGEWRKHGPRGVTAMPFRLHPWRVFRHPAGKARRAPEPLFALPGEPLHVNGRWRVQFEHDADPAVAIFTANPSEHVRQPGEIAGTFLTTTGDYRYLAGTARGDQVRLSCFDGAHAFLFHATLQDDGTLHGEFWSGANWHETWTAERDDEAQLPDAFMLTKALPDKSLAELRYPDAKGAEHRVGDLLGKVTLVVLMGTWCPNCGDAGIALQELRERHGDRGLRVLGLAFEHGDDAVRHARVVADYQQARGVDWPILIAGSSDKTAATTAFPIVDRVRSYPTILFVDREGAVRAVHQGFCGPATGAAFVGQQRRFEALVERLLAEAG